jgi:cytochrome c oxidase cbb3-type subunit 3
VLRTALLLLALAGCDREARESRGQPLPETGPLTRVTSFNAGGPVAMPVDVRAAHYGENAFHLSEGQRLYEDFNCSGCHAHGGGDIGPPLMDDEWIYGGQAEQIVATIAQGRPNGMPSFANKLTEQQMWQLAAYVRSLSGNVPKDAASSRGDTMSSIEPPTLKAAEPVRPATPPTGQGVGR